MKERDSTGKLCSKVRNVSTCIGNFSTLIVKWIILLYAGDGLVDQQHIQPRAYALIIEQTMKIIIPKLRIIESK